MSVLIKGLNIKPRKDGFGGKGLVIIGYDDKLYLVAHEQIIPLPDHGDLIDAEEEMRLMQACEYDTYDDYCRAFDMLDNAPIIIPAERNEE